jgi:AcrR family transcriptional regulator
MLLAAAEEVFAERGFAAAEVAEIARRAGVPARVFDLHFDSKEAALDAIVLGWVERVAALFAEPADYADVVDDPDALLDFCIERDVRLYEFFWETRATLRILRDSRREHAALIDSFKAEMQRRNRAWLDQWRRENLLRPDVDSELAATLMGGAYEALSVKMLQSQARPPLEAWLEFALDTFLRAYGSPELVAALDRRARPASERWRRGIPTHREVSSLR